MQQAEAISHNDLMGHLSSLRQALNQLDGYTLKNIVFFDSHSFYCYLKNLPCGDGATIEAVLRCIEGCIPFALTDESFTLFLSARHGDSAERLEALRQSFLESCKTDFLLLLLSTKEPDDWQEITKLCETLRQKNCAL